MRLNPERNYDSLLVLLQFEKATITDNFVSAAATTAGAWSSTS